MLGLINDCFCFGSVFARTKKIDVTSYSVERTIHPEEGDIEKESKTKDPYFFLFKKGLQS